MIPSVQLCTMHYPDIVGLQVGVKNSRMRRLENGLEKSKAETYLYQWEPKDNGLVLSKTTISALLKLLI